MSIKVSGPLGLTYGISRYGREYLFWQVTSESTSVPAMVEVKYPEADDYVSLSKTGQGASYTGELGGRTVTLIDSTWRGIVAGPEHPNGDPVAPVLTVAGKPTFRVDTGTETMIVAAGPIRLAEVSS